MFRVLRAADKEIGSLPFVPTPCVFFSSPQLLTERGISSSTPREGKSPAYVDLSYKAFNLASLICNF